MKGLFLLKVCCIKMTWDDGVWCAESDDELGIVLESPSFDALVNRIHLAVPEMLQLNCGYTGNVKILFDVERTDLLVAV